MSERRQSLKIIGTIGATCAFPFAADELYAQQEHTHADAVEASLPEPVYFSKSDFSLLAQVAERIIPATDTPGAIAAGVPAYIDFVVSRSAEQKKIFKSGLAWMRKHRLEDLEALCKEVDSGVGKRPEHRWFKAMKSLTADGYWTSKTGMAQTLGFKSASILAEYPECHEH